MRAFEYRVFEPGAEELWTPQARRLIIEDIFLGSIKAVSPEDMSAYVPLGEKYVYCGFGNDEKLVALGVLDTEPDVCAPEVWSLRDLVVHKDHRNRGYGAKMLSRVEQVASAGGAAALMIYPFNSSADFYIHHGYKPMSLSPKHVEKRLRAVDN